MQTLRVDLGNHAYNIEIGTGILTQTGAKLRILLPEACKAAIISDSNVAPLYAAQLQDSLAAAGLPSELIIIKAGEQSKNMQVLSDVLEKIAIAGLSRSDVLVTLGGGVVGDLGGFAAASYMRGIAFVQVPTSLLAQIDSSVGGKVAVDLKSGKNLAGAFYQPKAVFIDTELLKSLPLRFLHDGLAEAIKYGCIQDKNLFERLAGYADDTELLADAEYIVARCCEIKARIVEQDEFDMGLRALLNFGHTIGHAVEQYYSYGYYTHGEGVAIGMYQLTRRTEEMGLTPIGTAAKIAEVLQKYNLPFQADVGKKVLLDTMARDKKKKGDSITLVILDNLGSGKLQKIGWKDMIEYLR
ncbi:MAG: 3-dehydroquinate synthase [Phascolarctobacterium sp.]|nr:3-dehydroquinate synthase [Phascolarctobacterium sp.]